MEPLESLVEAPALPAFALPEELTRLYGGSFGLAPACLVANFVATVDGVVAIPGLERSNALIADGSEADRFVMALLRGCADAVLVGSGTLHGSPGSLWRADTPFPSAAPALAELRQRLGLGPQPAVAVVSAGGGLPREHPVLEAGALVLTTEAGAARLRGEVPAAAELVAVSRGEAVDVGAAVAALRARGFARILTEGGPTLFGSLLSLGLVDELFLTVSPLLAGRTAVAGRSSLVEGAELLPGRRVAGDLLGLRRHGAHLFLRYGLTE